MQFICNLNSPRNFTCPSGKLKTYFTSPTAKSSSPVLLAIGHWFAIMYLLCLPPPPPACCPSQPPKKYIKGMTFVFNFSWILQSWRQCFYKILGGQTRCIMGNAPMENVDHGKKVANDPWGPHLNFFKMISKQSIYGNKWVELSLFIIVSTLFCFVYIWPKMRSQQVLN